MADFLYKSFLNALFSLNLIFVGLFFMILLTFILSDYLKFRDFIKMESALLLLILIFPIVSSIFRNFIFFEGLYEKYDVFYNFTTSHPKDSIIALVLFNGCLFINLGMLSGLPELLSNLKEEPFLVSGLLRILGLLCASIFFYMFCIGIYISYKTLSTGIVQVFWQYH